MLSAVEPLDRVVWSALAGRQADLAVVRGPARRYHPDYGLFAAVADHSDASLASLGELIGEFGELAMLEPSPPAHVPGAAVASQEAGVQMVATDIGDGLRTDQPVVALGDADAAEMLALATLTRPGPFFARTHRLGAFIGVRVDGRLVAMAGERIRPEGGTELSGVCTHPDHRGHGYAAALSRIVTRRILGRGEVAFLHAYASNEAAIALYRALGFEVRLEVLMTRLVPA